MKNSSDTIRNQTHDLPAGSARTRQKDDRKSKATPFSKTKRITTCLCEQKKKKKKKKKGKKKKKHKKKNKKKHQTIKKKKKQKPAASI